MCSELWCKLLQVNKLYITYDDCFICWFNFVASLTSQPPMPTPTTDFYITEKDRKLIANALQMKMLHYKSELENTMEQESLETLHKHYVAYEALYRLFLNDYLVSVTIHR